MISIRKTVTELERCHQIRDLALDCYANALNNSAHYAIELDPQATAPYRQYLSRLVSEISKGDATALEESRATVRGLMREYRDKAAEYLARLRDELTETARALQEIMESISQSDGDHETRLRGALVKLRSISLAADPGPLRDSLIDTAGIIENSLEQIRHQHQITVTQFLTEIRMLHKRIDTLESAACIDGVTKLFNRSEMETRIQASSSKAFCLLLLRVSGLRNAAASFSPEVSSELTGAFSKRLRNSLPENSVIGRWGPEDFVAILHAPKAEAITLGKFLGENLGGSYACLQAGKTVRPSLQLRIAVVDSNGDLPEKVIERIGEFLPG